MGMHFPEGWVGARDLDVVVAIASNQLGEPQLGHLLLQCMCHERLLLIWFNELEWQVRHLEVEDHVPVDVLVLPQ